MGFFFSFFRQIFLAFSRYLCLRWSKNSGEQNKNKKHFHQRLDRGSWNTCANFRAVSKKRREHFWTFVRNMLALRSQIFEYLLETFHRSPNKELAMSPWVSSGLGMILNRWHSSIAIACRIHSRQNLGRKHWTRSYVCTKTCTHILSGMYTYYISHLHILNQVCTHIIHVRMQVLPCAASAGGCTSATSRTVTRPPWAVIQQ